ncbi:MAG: alpha-hydroxy-acid oxidizing protein [Dehalococcoidia bacterium]|nr:alpha-hydroxy-acid oxidizing protein [Dehalococcoidia bacterium]
MPEQLALSQLYAKGVGGLRAAGYARPLPPDAALGTPLSVNRAYLDSLFFTPRFFSSVEADTSSKILGIPVKVPMFCGPMGGWKTLGEDALVECARGLKAAGALLTLGIGGSDELQRAVDTGVPVVKIVKPYRNTDLIFRKLEDAKRRGCVAVGMDIDHFHGRLVGDSVDLDDTFAPQSEETVRNAIAHTRLPFIVKGVLGVDDALKAVEYGAKAIVVSNHGQASLDCATPSVVALPHIVEAVGARVEVYVDTGFRTGNDIVKGLAMGAVAVGFGNSILLAWGAGKADGVRRLVELLGAEMRRTMSALGCPDCASLRKVQLQRIVT